MEDRGLISLDEWRARQALARDGMVLFDPETGEPQESGALDRARCLAWRGATWGMVVNRSVIVVVVGSRAAVGGAAIGALAVAVALAVHWGWL